MAEISKFQICIVSIAIAYFLFLQTTIHKPFSENSPSSRREYYQANEYKHRPVTLHGRPTLAASKSPKTIRLISEHYF